MEVKHNVSAFDNTPVTAGPEVHTGRAVFVDEELYEKDASYKAKVDKCVEEGFHRVVEGESGGSGESGGDKGYSCTEECVTLTDESVTTAAAEGDSSAVGDFTYSEDITADTIKVTFNGTEYNVPVFTLTASFGTIYVYGARYSDELANYDFSIYPFGISSVSGINRLATETAGTYQVKIEALEETIETSECFKKAVKSVGGSGVMMLHLTSGETSSIEGATWEEAHEALASGAMVYLNGIDSIDGRIMPCAFYSATIIGFDAVTIDSVPRVFRTAIIWNSDGTITKRTYSYPSAN